MKKLITLLTKRFYKVSDLDIALAREQAKAELDAVQLFATQTNKYLEIKDKKVQRAIKEHKEYLGDI